MAISHGLGMSDIPINTDTYPQGQNKKSLEPTKQRNKPKAEERCLEPAIVAVSTSQPSTKTRRKGKKNLTDYNTRSGPS
jgi:hypothetical protein